jgi:hypothetical protein
MPLIDKISSKFNYERREKFELKNIKKRYIVLASILFIALVINFTLLGTLSLVTKRCTKA